MYKKIFNRLPERFRKQNTEKLYYVLFDEKGAFLNEINSVEDSRNIDNATGDTLDLIGGNVGQFRQGEDDELYRQLIKVRIIANMSIGNIDTINLVTSVLVKEVFIGLQEAWPESEWDYEPSAIVLELTHFLSRFPIDLINTIKAAGVRILFLTKLKQNIYYAHYAVIDREKTLYQRLQSEFEKEHKYYQGMANILSEKEITFLFPSVYFIKDDGINVSGAYYLSKERVMWK